MPDNALPLRTWTEKALREATEAEPSGVSPRRYASPLIAERRARILEEAKKLISEVGAEKFTVRDLGQRANVSVATIYNIFGDKEGVIGLALREFHAGIKLVFPTTATNLKSYCSTVADTTKVVIANRAYALALGDLYFSPSLSTTLFDVIRGMPLQVSTQWLWAAERENLLRESADIVLAQNSFANLEWGSVKDWGAGRLLDDQLSGVRQRSFLIFVLTVSNDTVRDAALKLLQELS
jgi:AcrR family transcriptional regulator